MLSSILAATDLSTRSERALRRAAMLAAEAGARLTLLHVVDDDRPEAVVAHELHEAERLLAAHARALADRFAVAPRVSVRTGHPAGTLAAEALRGGHDLLVMGAHRRRLLADVFVGTTVERVIRTCRRPVLMASGPASGPWRSVVAALDFGETSDRALAVAEHAGFLDTPRLTLAHALGTDQGWSALYTGSPDDVARDALFRAHAEAAAEIRRRRDRLALPADTLVGAYLRTGVPARVVAEAVADAQADLLVIGTRGAGAVSRLTVGSVADALLRTLEIDVLAVAEPAPSEEIPA